MWRNLGLSAVLFAVPLMTVACSDDCKSPSDCASGEVCYGGTCRPLSQDYVSCDTTEECDTTGSGLAECRAGRCVLTGTTIIVRMDSGVPANDGGPAPRDAGPDAGPRDATPDTGMPDTGMVADTGVLPDGG